MAGPSPKLQPENPDPYGRLVKRMAEIERKEALNPARDYQGKTNIITTQSTTSTSFTYLATPDMVPRIVCPADGLIAVTFKALWSVGGAGSGSAAIFVGTAQAGIGAQGSVAAQAVSVTGSVNDGWLTTCEFGLATMANTGTSSTDSTGPTIVGFNAAGGGGGSGLGPAGGTAWIHMPVGGTYDVGIKYKVSGAGITVTAKKRYLWVVSWPI